MFRKGEYLQSSTINLKATIPRKLAGLPNEQMDLFCYPEYNSQSNQLEPLSLRLLSHFNKYLYPYLF